MRIKIAITDGRIRTEDERGLALLGCKVVKLPPFSRLSAAVASHTDMLIHRIGDEYISYADYAEEAPCVFSDLSALLVPCGARFTLSGDSVSAEYPADVGMNALSIGGRLYCRRESISPAIIAAAERNNMEIINTAQGYPACTVLKLGEESAVTADRGMAKILLRNGIRVTVIENGDIELAPYDYGFIGGCAGVNNGRVCFFGDPRRHRDADKILGAIKDAGMEWTALSSLPLADLGGIIFAEADIHQH